jgi:hypothetical protein
LKALEAEAVELDRPVGLVEPDPLVPAIDHRGRERGPTGWPREARQKEEQKDHRLEPGVRHGGL